tara:strand:- start:5729 stop:6070 length:342 start_codon:yes stop_codon:yes gene_type:complete
MIYKLLFLLTFFSPYNGYYNLQQIQCPNWVPGTNEIMPEQMTLSPAMDLHNKMRCYCQVVKVKERECLDNNVPSNICLQRTRDWVTNNLSLKNKNLPDGLVNLPTRNVIINVE